MKIAFVIPWFGLEIPGGAEAACRSLVYKFHEYGLNVEVLTTCVKQFNSDWNQNYYEPGIELLNGVIIRRFKVRQRNTKKFDAINYKFIHRLPVTSDEENVFIEEMINSPDLEHFLSTNKDKYSTFIFTPYMFGTTYHGIKQVIDKAIVLPAFHDEPYAYLNCFRKLFPLVKGMIFFSKPEAELANKIYDLKNVQQAILGLGVPHIEHSAKRFCEKFNLNNPFLLYAGRKDTGKNVDILIDYFEKMKQQIPSDTRLVLIGGGEIEIPNSIKNDVIDLGFVEEQDKYDGFSAADVLIQPSTNESFSIVIMESWQCQTPVLVHEDCEVTKSFCEESNGGLYFSNAEEFKLCIELLLNNKLLNKRLGENGRNFVKDNFAWEIVVKRYIEFINNLV